VNIDRVIRLARSRLADAKQTYTVEPLTKLTDEDICSIIKMKVLRVQYGTDDAKREDDMIDAVCYAIWLCSRILEEEEE